jgi:leucyl/phenylalanyl-tRNA--protein transferase
MDLIAPELLLEGYRRGIFPMALGQGEIGWFSPDPRAIIPIGKFHVPHGLARTLRRAQFEVRINTCFERVMRHCADRPDTWIDERIIESYCALHHRGFAHSVEAWRDGELGGGLYGVSIGSAFFGESMFTRITDGSKVALHGLVTRLIERGFMLLDTQWTTPHLESFGAIEIPRARYLKLLSAATARPARFR